MRKENSNKNVDKSWKQSIIAHSSTVASELCDVSGAGKLQNSALFSHTDGSSLSQ
jgi:hypothetical protein